MKTITITAMLALLTIAIKAQIIVDKTDPFTHQKTKGAIVILGKSISPQPIGIGVFELKNKKYLVFSWSAAAGTFGAFNTVDINKTGLLFKFSTDTVFNLRSIRDTSLNFNTGMTSALAIITPITDNQLMYFVNNKIDLFRVAMDGDKGVDLDGPYMFTDRNKKQFRKAAMYMLGLQEIHDQE